jgi:RHS repeat-associated protein
VTLWSQEVKTYDGLNRPSSTTDRDNALTTFDYDAGNNLTNRVMPGGLKWRATYNVAGQMLKSYNLASDGSGTRTNLYTYYSSGNIFAGLLQTFTDGRGVVCTHTYDDFLRPATNSYTGSLPEHNQTSVMEYDARGLMTNITENFASTNTGPGTTVRRSYDVYGLLQGESVYINGTLYSSAGLDRDSAGRRSSLSFGDFNYNFGWRADGLLANAGYGSYNYTTAGLLSSSDVDSLDVNVTSRDGVGRILGRTSAVNGTTRLTETLNWTGDGLLSSHTVARQDYTDYRSYDYATLSRRLATERMNITNGVAWTNVFGYDNGASGGSGVLTRMAEPQAGGAEWTTGVDLFNRIDRETNNVIRRIANGRMNATAAYGSVSVNTDGHPLPVTTLASSDPNWPTQWQAMMELKPGTHTLQAVAKHSSGLFTTNKTAVFTNNAVDQTTLSHFDEGQLAYRVWKNSSGQTNRVQTFKWDGRSRLLATTELDANNNGYDWSAVYDPLGRRLQTTTIIVTNGIALTNQPKVINQYFDPEVEFLELATRMDGKTIWKIYGPDLDGTYGGMNGTGGLSGTVDDLGVFRPIISDARGNVHGSYDPYQGSMLWNASRPTGYGAIPEYRPTPLAENGDMAVSCAWNGRWPDISGLYWLGGRYYDPVSGSFVSCDPYGHDADPSLYAFCNGDPINYFDPDGRNPHAHDSSTGLRTLLGDIEFENGGMRIYSGGIEAFIPDGTGFNPFEGIFPDIDLGEVAANTFLNADSIRDSWHEVRNPDWTTPIGWAVTGVAGVSLIANTVDAVANFIPGKVLAENTIKTAAKDVEKVFVKNVAQDTFDAGLKNTLRAAEGTAMRNVAQFQGMEVRAVRDLSHVEQGTLEAMQQYGFAPTTVNGDSIVLHHLGQNPAGPLVEMPAANHSIWNTVQHPLGNTAGVGLTEAQRAAYNAWRTEYWQWRATQELNVRRALGN